MSQARQQRVLTLEEEPFLVVRSTTLGFPGGGDCRLLEHEHPCWQLLYAISGAMTVHAGATSWMIPAGKAVIIPAGCRHSMRMWGDVAMRTLYFPPHLEAEALR